MSLPNLNHAGELPIGIHQARIGEVIAQFGSGTTQREFVTARLRQIYQLAKDTGYLQQLIILKVMKNLWSFISLNEIRKNRSRTDRSLPRLYERGPRGTGPI